MNIPQVTNHNKSVLAQKANLIRTEVGKMLIIH